MTPRRVLSVAEREIQESSELLRDVAITIAARRLGVDPRTLRRWCLDGKCRSRRTIGGHHRIPLAELHRLENIVGQTGQTGHTA